jgi:hypothetical protein
MFTYNFLLVVLTPGTLPGLVPSPLERACPELVEGGWGEVFENYSI